MVMTRYLVGMVLAVALFQGQGQGQAQGQGPAILPICPEQSNTQVNCYGTNCQGVAEKGNCVPPNDSDEECFTQKVPCCGQNFVFANSNGPCSGGDSACGGGSQGSIGRVVFLAPLDSDHPRVVVVAARHRKAGAGAAAASRQTSAAF